MNKKLKSSVRIKLFATLAIVIIIIIAFLIIVSNAILEAIYYLSKKETSLNTYEYINQNIPKEFTDENRAALENELEKEALTNNFEMIILNGEEEEYLSHKNFLNHFNEIALQEITYDVSYSIMNRSDLMYSKDGVTLKRAQDRKNGLNFLLLAANLDNGNKLYIRMPISPIKESVSISNQFLAVIGVVTIILGGSAIIVITDRFTKPIEELNEIANSMANLDFTKKYRINDEEDEINELGRSINTLSDKLETTINQLKTNNSELEKDIEVKSKIDEMRKQFVSDVSHELKTPIALIQGYAEGLKENVTTDEESREFYTDVILDEANKMDKLVKRLLELMKLEYEDRELNNSTFDIVELINGVIKNSKVVLEEENINVEMNVKDPIYVYADDFYIEQVVTNYFTNAIKNISVKGGLKRIKINIKNSKDPNKLRVSVYNTGNNIPDEMLERIWTRFYKGDSSRNREKGGTGIGLALVKAIMNKYNNSYGVVNKKDGVEFYFEINKIEIKENKESKENKDSKEA